METTATEAIIRRIITTGSYTEEELTRVFRYLSKKTHPDLVGGDGETFIRLRATYNRAKEKSRREKPTEFDPYLFIREAGFSGKSSPRLCLYISLKIFFTLGMHNYKRRQVGGAGRNQRLILSIFHWGRLYDPAFSQLFTAYMDKNIQLLSTSWQVKNFKFGRRLFGEGVTGFFTCQRTENPGTARVAGEKLRLSGAVIARTVGPGHPVANLGEWFFRELQKPAFGEDFF